MRLSTIYISLFLIFTSITVEGQKKINRVLDADTLEQVVINMEQVVVTATRTQKKLKNVPVITHVITARQIQNGGYQNIEDILESDLPGVEFNRHGVSNDITITGTIL